jgi:predicted TIM-barrel fold metal-dependent hydrolase
VRLVDSQCHVSNIWYEPVETLLDQMHRSGVAQAVLIQMLGQFDNTYQQACVRAYPERFASVVAVDPARHDACDRLGALASEGAAGVRLRPDARSPGTDPLAIWRTADSLGLAVSCVGTAEQFSAHEFLELIAALPGLAIVLEHLGGTSRAGATDVGSRRRALAAGRYPNVYLKVPGLGELVPRPFVLPEAGAVFGAEAAVAELELAFEHFGPERLMWGSDFPVVGSREGYANALGWTRAAIAALWPATVARVFGDTARAVFKLA